MTIFPGRHLSTGIPCYCHVLESHVGPHWKETDTVTWNVNSGYLQSILWPFTDVLGVGCQVALGIMNQNISTNIAILVALFSLDLTAGL